MFKALEAREVGKMTKLLELIETEEDLKIYEEFKKDINNFCLNIDTYLCCMGCNGYSSKIVCQYYESNNLLKELEFINEAAKRL